MTRGLMQVQRPNREAEYCVSAVYIFMGAGS